MAHRSHRGTLEEGSVAHGMWKRTKSRNGPGHHLGPVHGPGQSVPWSKAAEEEPLNTFRWTGNSPAFVKPRSSASYAVTSAEEKKNRLWKHFLDEKKSLAVTAAASVSVLERAPATHTFKKTGFQPALQKMFFSTVRKEMALLSSSLPEGIAVKTFEDRMDIFSALIKGPTRTPYEDGLFLFDIQLPSTYPAAPPLFHYLSQCSGRLNPNLYEDGKVCVSLLGTWSGHGTERWTSKSNLMQVLVSIQGLILVDEPYYNEPGCEHLRGQPRGNENSRHYNEETLIRVVQSMTRLLRAPVQVFSQEIQEHFSTSGWRLAHRLESWLELHESVEKRRTGFFSFRPTSSNYPDVGFPLFPLSTAGSVRSALSQYRAALVAAGIPEHAKDDKYAVKKVARVDADTRPTATKNRGNVSANQPNTGPNTFSAFEPYAPVGNTAGSWAHVPNYNPTGLPNSYSQHQDPTFCQRQQSYSGSAAGKQLSGQQQQYGHVQPNGQPQINTMHQQAGYHAGIQHQPQPAGAWAFQFGSSGSFQKQAGATQQYRQAGKKHGPLNGLWRDWS